MVQSPCLCQKSQANITQSLTDSSSKLVDALVTSVQRRQIVGSLNVALATGALIQNVVRTVRYSTVEELIAIIKSIGRRLVNANPRGECLTSLSGVCDVVKAYRVSELAAGNIIRRIVKLIREEYRIAVSKQPSAPPSLPETPFFGPTTPGLTAPPTHYLSYDMTTLSAPSLNRQASLSNFVAMRHSRAQLERAGSVGDTSLSAATNALFTSPADRRGSTDDLIGSPKGDDVEESTRNKNLRPFIAQVIDEVLGELETTHDDVAKEAKEHIHSSCVITTSYALRAG